METWTLDTCGLLSLFTSCVVLWTAFVNLKTQQNVKHLHNTRKSKKMAATNQRLVQSLPPSLCLPLPLSALQEGTMSWHFTFHFECSSCGGPINQKTQLWSLYFLRISVIFRYPQPNAKHFRCSLHCLSLRRSQRVHILTYSTVCLLISACLGPAGHKLQPIKAQSCTLLVKSREQSNNNANNIANLPLIVS